MPKCLSSPVLQLSERTGIVPLVGKTRKEEAGRGGVAGAGRGSGSDLLPSAAPASLPAPARLPARRSRAGSAAGRERDGAAARQQQPRLASPLPGNRAQFPESNGKM